MPILPHCASFKRPSWQLPTGAAFPLLALILFSFFVAASAPSPLFVVFQHQWGFSSALLTVAFAIYAIALLVSLLIAGALSDFIGRRPVVLVALLLQALAMVLFFSARGIGALIGARIVQGIATGMVSGALSAAVVEAAPAAQKRFGAMVGSISPLAGLAVGALLTGLAVELAARPVPLVFGVLAAICSLGAVAILFIPETVTRRAGALASLLPRMSVPHKARAEFVSSLPVTFSVWALGGLFLSLVPSVMQQVFDIHSGILNGLVIAVLFGSGSVAPTVMRRLPPAKTRPIGMGSIATGVGIIILSLHVDSASVFFAGAALAGVGFGAAFSAQMQLLAPLAEVHERAELFAALYAVSYLAFSVPAMFAGASIVHFGLRLTVESYLVLVMLVAAGGACAYGIAWKQAATGTRTKH